MGDYFTYWLSIGKRLKKPPLVFRVNWFRKDESGKFLWPGYGENIRVLKWILSRVQGKGDAVETPIGYLPTPDSIDTAGLRLKPSTLQKVLSFERDSWIEETDEIEKFFVQFGDRIPPQMWHEIATLKHKLSTPENP